MKRPPSIGGRSLPKETGKCALCGEPLGSPRDGTMSLVYENGPCGKARFRLVCRDREACQQRQRAQLGRERAPSSEILPGEVFITLPSGGTRAEKKP